MKKVIVICVALLWAQPVMAGFGEGESAYEKQDYEAALKEWRPLAESGDAQSQERIGKMYLNGQGVAKDLVGASQWFIKSATQDNISAQANLGYMYLNGLGVERDYNRALDLFVKAALKGDAEAQNYLAYMLQNGLGTEKDLKKAAAWYTRAAENGSSYSQYNLGLMYLDGQGVDKDNAKAADWFSKAAKQGNKDAETKLDELTKQNPKIYESVKGDGMKPDESTRQSPKIYKSVGEGHITYSNVPSKDAKEITLVEAEKELETQKRPVKRIDAKKFPYTAEFTCTNAGRRMTLFQCFAPYYGSAGTDLEIRNGKEYKMYQYMETTMDYVLTFPLRNHFSINAQNSASGDLLNLIIKKTKTGEVIFQKSAGSFGVISVTN